MPRTNLTDDLIDLLSKSNESLIVFAQSSNCPLEIEKLCNFFKYFYTQLRLFPNIKRRVLENLTNSIDLIFNQKSTFNKPSNNSLKSLTDKIEINLTSQNDNKDQSSKSPENQSHPSAAKNLKLFFEELELSWSFIDSEIEKELIRRNIPNF